MNLNSTSKTKISCSILCVETETVYAQLSMNTDQFALAVNLHQVRIFVSTFDQRLVEVEVVLENEFVAALSMVVPGSTRILHFCHRRCRGSCGLGHPLERPDGNVFTHNPGSVVVTASVKHSQRPGLFAQNQTVLCSAPVWLFE